MKLLNNSLVLSCANVVATSRDLITFTDRSAIILQSSESQLIMACDIIINERQRCSWLKLALHVPVLSRTNATSFKYIFKRISSMCFKAELKVWFNTLTTVSDDWKVKDKHKRYTQESIQNLRRMSLERRGRVIRKGRGGRGVELRVVSSLCTRDQKDRTYAYCNCRVLFL